MLGLEEVKWGDEYIATDDQDKEGDIGANKRVIKTKQTSLSDFLKWMDEYLFSSLRNDQIPNKMSTYDGISARTKIVLFPLP